MRRWRDGPTPSTSTASDTTAAADARVAAPCGAPKQLDAANAALCAAEVVAEFKELSRDAETEEFLASCTQQGWVQSMATALLRLVYSLTDTNAILNRGQMFVLSHAHARQLLPSVRGGRLLDVGAGDGNVTARLAPLFDEVVTTEVSAPMAGRLRERGYRCEELPDLAPLVSDPSERFDVVSCLNVLDRCDRPMSMLRDMRLLLKPGGVVLLAVVLPFSAIVEDRTGFRAPAEELDMAGGLHRDGASFEAALSVLVRNVLAPARYTLVSASRVPYLSRGDYWEPYYVLNDALLVLRPQGGEHEA